MDKPFKFGATKWGIHYEGDFKICPKKFEYSNEVVWSGGQGLQARSREGYFTVGSGVHEGLARWYEEGASNASAVARALAYIDAEAREYPSILPDQIDKSKEEVAKLLLAYFDRWPKGSETFKVVAPEMEVEVELAPGVKFTVRIDLIVQDIPTGRYFIKEHKTTSKDQAGFEKSFALDPQITGLIFGGRKHTGYPISGVSVNAIRKKPVDFYRFPVFRQQEDIDLWVKERLSIRDAIARTRESGFWCRHEGEACVNPITGKECLFRLVCMFGANEQVYKGMYLPKFKE